MAFAARYAGTCKVCSKPISVGQMINWDRTKRGFVYHADCLIAPSTPEKITEVPDEYLESEKPSSAPDIASILKALEAIGVKVPSAVGVEAKPVKPAPKSAPKSEASTKVRENSKWYEVLSAILPHSNRILLIGPPSTGKSTTALKVAGHIAEISELSGVKVGRITMTETTSREDLTGMFHLIAGETKWVDGPITTAMRNGMPVIIEEIDRYSPECASLLYSIIDDRPHLSLPTGELVSAKEGFKVLMTSNESLETLPVAVQDRIEAILLASEPHIDAISDLPAASQEVCLRFYRSQPAITVKMFPTVRRMRYFHKLINAGIDANLAATIVFGKGAAAELLSTLTSAEGTR